MFSGASEDLEALWQQNQVCYPDDPTSRSGFEKVVRQNPTWLYCGDSDLQASLISESVTSPYIWSVTTYPAHRGKGLATALINEFEKYYAGQRGPCKAWLHTRVDNPAQKLYFDLGYRITSFEPNIYGMSEHGIVMRKRIG